MNVAVTGVGATAGLGIVRALRQADLPLRLLGLDADAWAPALYLCDAQAVVPRVSEEDRYLEALEALIRRHRIDALIPGLDVELDALSRARDRFRSLGCCVIVGPPEFIGFAGDKEITYRVLRDKGIPFARTQAIDDFRRSCTPASFPVIVKPRGGAGSVGVTVLCGPSDLERYRPGSDDIVQEYLIPATWGLKTLTPADAMRGERLRQDDEVRVQTLIAPSGEILLISANINVQVRGTSMRVCPTNDPALLDFGQRAFPVLAAMGAVGPCNLQGRITDAGLVLYEVNARFTGCAAIHATMGHNECEAALRLFVLGESPASVASRLTNNTGAVCLRYLTETVVPCASIDGLVSPDSRG
jgi:carbamoyl-phosphate synthase large subunit